MNINYLHAETAYYFYTLLGFRFVRWDKNKIMKPVISKEDATYYVDEAEFIKFVEQNSEYGWNKLCDICRDEVFNEEGKTYFTEKPTNEHHTEFAVEWIGAFYDAHPFMERIMFVFDS